MATAEQGKTVRGDRAAAMNAQIAEMRRMLRAMTAPSGADALTALRKAFPDAPLSLRIAALSGRGG